MEGIVTVDDILGELVGDIPEAGEADEASIIQRTDGSWLVDGMLPVDEFQDFFEVPDAAPVEAGDFYTVGGLLVSGLGRVPDVGDRLAWGHLVIEVMDMDGRRVDKVLVTLVDPEKDLGEPGTAE